MYKKLFLKSFLIICISTAFAVNADVPTKQVSEVQHLLDFVKNSNCVINRNGTEHIATKGVKHIQRKYDHFRDDIETTEDFIRLSATKSTMSGKFYTVKCPGKMMMNTQDWLLAELEVFRLQKKKTQMNANERN